MRSDHENLDSAFSCIVERMEQIPQEIRSFAEYLWNEIKPVHALEIGVRHGGTAALWTQICTGQVIGIDWYDTDSLGKEGTDRVASSMESKYPNYTFLRGDSHDIDTIETLYRLMRSRKIGDFDLIFLDGDHSYTGVKKDFQMYSDLLSVRGVIAFHDIVESDFIKQVGHGVWKFWKELKSDPKYISQEFSIGSDWGGIGSLRLKEKGVIL